MIEIVLRSQPGGYYWVRRIEGIVTGECEPYQSLRRFLLDVEKYFPADKYNIVNELGLGPISKKKLFKKRALQ